MKTPREMDLEKIMAGHADKMDKLEKSIPGEEQLNGIVQGLMAAVDAKIAAAVAASEAKDKRDDAAQLQAVAMMIKDAVEAQTNERNDAANDRKAMMALMQALAKPRRKTGEVTLPTGKVQMIISEMLDS